MNCCCSNKPDKQTNTFPKAFKKSKKILSKYYHNNLEILDDEILEVLIRLYVAENKEKAINMLSRCRINPNLQRTDFRSDLEYYIPQIVNYLVFHQQLQEEELVHFMIKASKIDFFFAHLVYFQLKSLSEIRGDKISFSLKVVQDFLQLFQDEMLQNYKGTLLIASKILQIHFEQSSPDLELKKSYDFHVHKASMKQDVYKGIMKQKQTLEPIQIRDYGTEHQKNDDYVLESASDINLLDYSSKFNKLEGDKSFLSNIEFWQDITQICDAITTESNKTNALRELLRSLNEALPAAVYIPFVNQSLRHYVILNVVASESRVFSTKMRSPYSLCLELYRPEEESQLDLTIDKQISIPLTTNMVFEFHRTNTQDLKQNNNGELRRSLSYTNKEIKEQMKNEIQNLKFQQLNSDFTHFNEFKACGVSKFYQTRENDFSSEDIQIDQMSDHRTYTISGEGRSNLESSLNSKVSYLQTERGIHLTQEQYQAMKHTIFGESLQEQENRIRLKSPFRNLKSWTTAHLIVKTGDNLKQEQFALQLICQFDQIFKKEGLPLKLRYYEVISLGPDSGIIQMVKNATTIDSLQKNLQLKFKEFTGFSDFFRSFFRDNMQTALNNYLHSLVAYSLVCYFLQVKDRHNGNILLDTDGHLIHIDFGFFLSIAPGKGLEFEKKVPFKLLSEYIQVLGGVKGQLFQENFRRLFYQGFKAAQKHQKEIMLLVEMMYTGHGTTLPCLKKGEIAIRELESRFNPRVASDAELFVFTQNLINASLDNWRAKWYDKFQYYMQGVFY